MKGVQMTSSRAVLITVAQVCVIVIILHRLYPRLRAAPSFPAKSVARDRKNQGRNRLEVRALRLPQLPLTFSLIFSGSRDICKIRRAYSWRIYNLSDPLNLIDLFRWSIFFYFDGKISFLPLVSTSLQCLHHASQLVSFKCKESRISSTLAFSATLPQKEKSPNQQKTTKAKVASIKLVTVFNA